MGGGAVTTAPRDSGSKKQLFLDDALLAGSSNVAWTMNSPRKTGECCIVYEHLSESFLRGGFGSSPCQGPRVGATRRGVARTGAVALPRGELKRSLELYRRVTERAESLPEWRDRVARPLRAVLSIDCVHRGFGAAAFHEPGVRLRFVVVVAFQFDE
jgi:hypothetical protein